MNKTIRTLGLLAACLFACDGGDDSTDPTDSPGGKADSPEAACCEPDDKPFSIEGAHCCADGTWAADVGNGDPSV